MQQEAEKLGLSLEPTAEGFAKLSASATALNVPMSQQKALFDAFAKASTTLHLSTENSNRALLALEQMFAKGKIQAQELRLQLGQAIPGAAARFQQAVLQMTKGTDLAGKSFDQLLKQGLLYTDQFLPALVQALQESSRGWQDASESLNAQLNRLKTAWFQLRVETSNGLFNDVATQSVKLMANNLDKLASVAGVAGSVLAARFAGKGLDKLADRVIDLKGLTAARIADAQAAAVQAERELALASANAARTAAARTKSAALKASLEQTLRTDLGEKERIATLNRLGKVTARMVGENIAYRDSLASLATAQRAAAASEAELAAARSASVLGRAAKGVGNFALGLVGGWAGAAVLAIGAIGYAIYKNNKAWEDRAKALHEQIALSARLDKANKDLVDSLNAQTGSPVLATDAFKQVQESLSAFQKIQQSINEKTVALQDARAKFQSASNSGNFGNAAEAIGAQNKIAELTDQLGQLRKQADITRPELEQTAQAVLNMLPPGRADKLIASIHSMTFGVGDATTSLQKFQLILQFMPQALQNAFAEVSKQQSKLEDLANTFNSMTAESEKFVRQFGMTDAQKIYDDLQRALAENKGTDQSRQALKDAAARAQDAAITKAIFQQIQDARKKAAEDAVKGANAQAEANRALRSTQDALLLSLQGNLEGHDKMTASERKLYNMTHGLDKQFNKLSGANQKARLAEQKHIVSLEGQVDAMDKAKKKAQALATVQQELARISQQFDSQRGASLAAVGMGSQAAQRMNERANIVRQFNRRMAQYGEEYRTYQATNGQQGISKTQYDQ